ncbi:MAG: hypothetical protein AVO34_13190 [Firmicutes bacterium ML8_F2]|jgi:anaerobic carbon-monoxide dehydrogenase iron sulfur subunit|nr:MAG: hypothetical protein AVO34_13190 [Firmicutes bacterium ML8_F2]
MTKKIIVKEEACIGCSLCLLNCVFNHEKIYAAGRARLRVVREDALCLARPLVCRQCENAPCMNACPEEAIACDEDGLVSVDESLCSGCGACVEACPYGVMMFDSVENKAFKCDLCGGEPSCVSHCPTGALEFK